MKRVWLIECQNQKTGEWNTVDGDEVYHVKKDALVAVKDSVENRFNGVGFGGKFRVVEYVAVDRVLQRVGL